MGYKKSVVIHSEGTGKLDSFFKEDSVKLLPDE